MKSSRKSRSTLKAPTVDFFLDVEEQAVVMSGRIADLIKTVPDCDCAGAEGNRFESENYDDPAKAALAFVIRKRAMEAGWGPLYFAVHWKGLHVVAVKLKEIKTFT